MTGPGAMPDPVEAVLALGLIGLYGAAIGLLAWIGLRLAFGPRNS